MEQGLPIRSRAEEVAGQLRLVVAGLPFLAERSWQEVGWGQLGIELFSLWRIELWLEPDRTTTAAPGSPQKIVVSQVERAAAPDGRCWVYGCQRDDWTLGPDSRLVEPLEFLSGQERKALMEILQQAACWPEPFAANRDTAWALAPAPALPEPSGRRRPPRQTRRKAQGKAQGKAQQQSSALIRRFASGFSG
jgi:hypothetical protein